MFHALPFALLLLAAPLRAQTTPIAALRSFEPAEDPPYDLSTHPLETRDALLLTQSGYRFEKDRVFAASSTVPIGREDLSFVLEDLRSRRRLQALLQIDMIFTRNGFQNDLPQEDREALRVIAKMYWGILPNPTRKDLKPYFSVQELEAMNIEMPVGPAPVPRAPRTYEAEDSTAAAKAPAAAPLRVTKRSGPPLLLPEEPAPSATMSSLPFPAAFAPPAVAKVPAPAAPSAAAKPAPVEEKPLPAPWASEEKPLPAPWAKAPVTAPLPTPAAVAAAPAPVQATLPIPAPAPVVAAAPPAPIPTPVPVPAPQPVAAAAPPAPIPTPVPVPAPQPVVAAAPPATPVPAPHPVAAAAAEAVPVYREASSFSPEEFKRFLAGAPYSREVKGLLELLAENAKEPERRIALGIVKDLIPSIALDSVQAGARERSILFERDKDLLRPGHGRIALSDGPVLLRWKKLFNKRSVLLPDAVGWYAERGLRRPPLEAFGRENGAEREVEDEEGRLRAYRDGSWRLVFSKEQLAGELLASLMDADALLRGWPEGPHVRLRSASARWRFWQTLTRVQGRTPALDRESALAFAEWIARPEDSADLFFLSGAPDERAAVELLEASGLIESARAEQARAKIPAPAKTEPGIRELVINDPAAREAWLDTERLAREELK
ncbi:MAG: hypothetical protein WC969_07005 [Elusimicrobiota bacterium]|jgi:hypothetical protein